MADKIKEIKDKVIEWWKQFTPKQRTFIIAAGAGILVAFAILFAVLTKPQYVLLANCENTSEASTIIELLEGASPVIKHRVSDDGLRIEVESGQLSDANLLLGANNIPSAAYTIDDVTSGGFTVTDADKEKRYLELLKTQMETDLAEFDNVKSATVQLNIPEQDGTLISKDEDSSAAIMIEPDGTFTTDHAATMARFVMTALGNNDIKKITIVDNQGNLLFSGEDDYSPTGSATGQLTVKQQAEKLLQGEIKSVLLGTKEFDLVEVSSNLTLDFATVEEIIHNYEAAEGQTQGVLASENIYSAESSGGGAGVPGTDSNGEDGTTYVLEDGFGSSSSVTEEHRDYLPKETVTTKTIPPGLIVYDQSSLSVAAIKYNVVKYEDAKSQGLLDGISWNEYKLANSARKKIEVDEDLADMVAKASGIAVENISLVAYEEPLFVDKEKADIDVMDVMQVVLIIIILGLLAFVILRGMRKEKTQQVEEELSVESLLQSTQERELEDIELEQKSETRRMIEKFVDDNPEAVAMLLRNWLNEDWG